MFGVGSLSATGVWDGSIYLRGGGDPTFGSQQFDTLNYGVDTGATVQQLALNLRTAGIRAIQGVIVGDGSYFDALRGTPATGFAPNLYVEGELSGLSFDDGFLSLAEDSLQPRPALDATRAFAAALRAAGVKVPSKTPIITGDTPAGARLLAQLPSPPMATLIRLTNAPSDNFFAETLLKDIGARFGAGGSTAAGRRGGQSDDRRALWTPAEVQRRLGPVSLRPHVAGPGHLAAPADAAQCELCRFAGGGRGERDDATGDARHTGRGQLPRQDRHPP